MFLSHPSTLKSTIVGVRSHPSLKGACTSAHLQEMDPRWTDSDSGLRSRCHNLVARACARGGMLDEGLELLDHMYKAEVNINRDTVNFPITFLDHCCIVPCCWMW